ncbi:MAG: leucine--tRNA ligase [Patescibacteria group bacterium]|nr:leucine--tRNA ligase [Patescibacteria group bacterium]
MNNYDHKKIESKWQETWNKNQTYKTAENSDKPKQLILDMFPYPSGIGLHVGHPRGFIATDVYSRMKRMMGFNVLHPMGWDAFGLPAENFAIKNKVHPRVAVEKNIQAFKDQLSVIGFDYDWSREINTTDPGFYKWTQWMFIQMFNKGLAYESNEPVNWCPVDKTVLANEDVEADGTCERCGAKVEKRPMRQWVLKITDYADRMLADLDKLSKWPEGVKEAQRNWIGRSEGSEIYFNLKFTTHPDWNERRDADGNPARLPVFTTRADTLFGVTYIVLAPEHPWVTLALDENHKDVIDNEDEVRAYVKQSSEKSDIDRTNAKKEKTGVRIEGVVAINPANAQEIPVYVADYVLANYGTGAVMAVPAHDERDFEFAKKYDLPIHEVVRPSVVDHVNPPRTDKATKVRRNVHAIVYDPKTEKYLIIRNSKFGWDTVVIGGVEEGEDLIEAATRELQEETGYADLEFKRFLGNPVQASYFAKHKDENRNAIASALYFELRSDAKIKIPTDGENEGNENVWVSKSEFVPGKMVNSELPYWLARLAKNNDEAYVESGILVNSGEFDGMDSSEARKKITEFVGGKLMATYRLKDWVFSRQRYWGEPIPMIHCEKCGVVPVPESELPVMLPEVSHYEPTGTGESPLAAIESWVNIPCPKCGGAAKRETNTMPQWAGSSWYYLRYIDPHNQDAFVDKDKEKHWMPVDIYSGADHATRHLIYARFWHKFLFDIGAVSTEEPFPRLEFLGYILDKNGKKFSKRDGNGIDPTDVVNQFGADAFRLYEMFIGPFEQTARWDMNGMVGTLRFVEKVWKISEKAKNANGATREGIQKLLHKTIKKVSDDIEGFKFNTAVSSLMILANEIDSDYQISVLDLKAFLKILAPFAPHVAEEIWHELGETDSIHLSDWPKYDSNLVIDDTVKLGIQVNGKVRAEIELAKDESEESVREKVFAMDEIKKWTDGKDVKKFIYVAGKIISIVI